MDLFDFLLRTGLITSALVLYLLFFKKQVVFKGYYRTPGWNYFLKVLMARYTVKRWKSQLPALILNDIPNSRQENGYDNISIRGTAPNGATVLLGIRKLCGRQTLAEITVHIKLKDGTSYILPHHPDTIVGVWVNDENGWRASGLKIQILEPEVRLRILYNGLLTRIDDNVTQHVKLNLLWSSVTKPFEYPKDWSDELAAKTLALEQWRDDKWSQLLGKWENKGWLQWGTIQGRFESFNEGVQDRSEYLQVRGVKERNWAPHAYEGLRRSFTITAAARDGTAVLLRGLSHHKILTQCLSGCVRFSDYTVGSITSTDLQMRDFCESSKEIPKIYTINVSTKNRNIKMVLRINDDGGKLYSGVPYQQNVVYRTIVADIDGEAGSGILELGYEPTAISHPAVRLTQPPLLNWLSERQAGVVGYCLSFDDRAAACCNYVGGKGASLALLNSMQIEEDYRVPPGFCITTYALEKHLEDNPTLRIAIKELEAANENYNELNFKNKCKRVSELFDTTAITYSVKNEILTYINDLKIKATDQNLGPQLRFAVRSSAVGEDSEALSAAGQNETILGCVSDEDILHGVQRCWGSMFAFNSAYYRRQNGQPCSCGGGVVVQALVAPSAAGVMFTRHPHAGDPSRLLITANYGLGESVVSGAVEPDSFVVKREMDGRLSLLKTDLGSKTQRVTVASNGVSMETIPESDRVVACLNETEVLRLAQLGVTQEELWGAARDIEWAICGNDIFLLQARPITSLERWSEEELLHELDFPIMSDDELTTFGNTGEVMPKPVTPMTYDFVIQPLTRGTDKTIGTNGSGYDHSVVITHNRCVLSLYNCAYKSIPREINVSLRMVEMAINGHKVADENILKTAQRRRPPHWSDQLTMMRLIMRVLTTFKSKLADSTKLIKEMRIEPSASEPYALLESISEAVNLMERFVTNHTVTTTASTSSQFIAMSILLEGSSDFTPEQCNEISTLLSSGEVLSAEVPQALARLTKQLEASGLFQEFREQNPKDGMLWLKKNIPHVYLDVCVFLEHHGHRAIMEFDLSTKPWILIPEDMIKVLQNLRSSDQDPHKTKTIAEVVSSLKTPQRPITRKLLSWILPLCRTTVRHREGTKAHLILAIHKIRLSFLQLGDMLVQRWYLPNRDLVFYFLLRELKDYIKKRDPALLKKAIQRQQYYSNWTKLKFAEINKGWVVPLEVRGPALSSGDLKMTATSVCGGEVVARACVVKDLSEIDQLRQGDVLITHATDIGWSPYFPLLTGIVTELGGLISHGAVIAREYGLPSIVGATNATYLFNTGDLVRLSGTDGCIERVHLNEKSN